MRWELEDGSEREETGQRAEWKAKGDWMCGLVGRVFAWNALSPGLHSQ